MGAYLIMPVLLAVFLLISALIGLRDRRRLDQKEREKLARSFGKPGDKEYSEGRLRELGNSPVPGLSAVSSFLYDLILINGYCKVQFKHYIIDLNIKY